MTKEKPLAQHTWRAIEPKTARALLLVPVGSTEQHGPHLPLSTDTSIACALAVHAATRMGERVIVAPAIPYGASGEHADFPGTISMGTEVLTTTLIEIGRSSDAFKGVVFVNGHGGNREALTRATTTLSSEERNVQAWSWHVAGADAHAGRTETSLMLAIAPDDVVLDAFAPGRSEPISELYDALVAGGVRSVSPNGVLGDPRGASKAEGERIIDAVVDDLVGLIQLMLGQSGVGGT